MTRVTAPLCLVLGLGLALSACGGSGGDPVPESVPGLAPTTLGGDYHVVENGAQAGTQISIWGSTFMSGFGDAERFVRTNENGDVSAFLADDPFTYDEPGAGLVTIDRPSHPWGVACEGAMIATGDIAALSSMGDGDMPSVQVLIRRAQGMLGGELYGDYVAVMSTRTPADPAIAGVGVAHFEHGITGNIEWLPFNLGGAVGAAIPPDWPLGFALAPDGFVRIAHSVLGAVDGGLTQNGEFCVVSGAHRGSDPGLAADLFLMLLRLPGVPMSNADLSGTYGVVGMDMFPGTGDFRSYSGTLTADGSGGATFSPRINNEGTPGITLPVPTTYDVTVDGVLDLHWGSRDYRGGVSESGHLAIVGGAVDDGSPPGFFILIRR